MSPRSSSRSVSPRRSYSKSPVRRNGRRKSNGRHVYDSRSRSNSRHPPSPPAPPSGRNGRYSGGSKSSSRSLSPRHRRRVSRSRSPHDKRRGTREKPTESRCIGVFGLSVYTTQQKIRELFSRFGTIERIQVVIDAQTGRSRGFCFIYYEDMLAAKNAKDECSGLSIDDRQIRVDYSITQRPHTPTPGVYMGKPTRSYREMREHRERYREDYRMAGGGGGSSDRRRTPPSPPNRSNYYYRSDRRRRYGGSRSRSYSPRRTRY